MKEIELYAGCNIDKALEIVKEETAASGEACFAKFNGKEIYSTDTVDEAYMKVLGKTKARAMKARDKKTGEIVEIERYGACGSYTVFRNSNGELMNLPVSFYDNYEEIVTTTD